MMFCFKTIPDMFGKCTRNLLIALLNMKNAFEHHDPEWFKGMNI